MILFIDTETTGLPDFNKRARDPAQPHIVQLAAIVTDDAGKVREEHNVLIRPEGWEIPFEATEVHGISTQTAKEFGVSEEAAASAVLDMMRRSSLFVAYNVTFDKFIMRIAMRRYALMEDKDDPWWKAYPIYCSMRKMTDICKIPNPTGRYAYKWPKLSEAYQAATGKPLADAHDAAADLHACVELYFWLNRKAVAK